MLAEIRHFREQLSVKKIATRVLPFVTTIYTMVACGSNTQHFEFNCLGQRDQDFKVGIEAKGSGFLTDIAEGSDWLRVEQLEAVNRALCINYDTRIVVFGHPNVSYKKVWSVLRKARYDGYSDTESIRLAYERTSQSKQITSDMLIP